MQSQVFTSLEIKEFKALLSETVLDAVKSEVTRLTTNHASTEKQYLTRQETAEIIGISLPTLHLWTKTGLINSFKIGTRVRYKLDDIKAAIKAQKYLAT